VSCTVRSTRLAPTLLSIAAVLILMVGTSTDGSPQGRPGIGFASDTPADVQELAASTWARFTGVFRGRWGCVPDVSVAGAWQLGDRAIYDPGDRLVTIRIPGTAPNLRATLVHEFAHHVDFNCAAQDRVLRRTFLAAQGFVPGTPWLHGKTWERTPSEQFAEAAIALVLGHDARPAVPVSRRALAAIRAWGEGP
jgi:hypothetical protein